MIYSSHLMGRGAADATPVPLTSCLLIFLIRLLAAWLFVGFPSFCTSSHTMFRWGMHRDIAFLWYLMVVEWHFSAKLSQTGLRNAIGLVCQVPIDVDISDCRKPFMGECRDLIVLRFVKEWHQGVQAVGVTVHDVLYLSIFGGKSLFFFVTSR